VSATVSRAVPDPAVQPTMKVGELAEVIGVSRASAYEAVKSGAIPSIKIGSRLLVPTAAVRRMLQLDGGPNAS
jgi:excisionase family DNA binding protein